MQLELNEVEREFIRQMESHKRAHGITNPTVADMLAVLTLMGHGPQEPEPGSEAA
jgi:hypothetical protein